MSSQINVLSFFSNALAPTTIPSTPTSSQCTSCVTTFHSTTRTTNPTSPFTSTTPSLKSGSTTSLPLASTSAASPSPLPKATPESQHHNTVAIALGTTFSLLALLSVFLVWLRKQRRLKRRLACIPLSRIQGKNQNNEIKSTHSKDPSASSLSSCPELFPRPTRTSLWVTEQKDETEIAEPKEVYCPGCESWKGQETGLSALPASDLVDESRIEVVRITAAGSTISEFLHKASGEDVHSGRGRMAIDPVQDPEEVESDGDQNRVPNPFTDTHPAREVHNSAPPTTQPPIVQLPEPQQEQDQEAQPQTSLRTRSHSCTSTTTASTTSHPFSASEVNLALADLYRNSAHLTPSPLRIQKVHSPPNLPSPPPTHSRSRSSPLSPRQRDTPTLTILESPAPPTAEQNPFLSLAELARALEKEGDGMGCEDETSDLDEGEGNQKGEWRSSSIYSQEDSGVVFSEADYGGESDLDCGNEWGEMGRDGGGQERLGNE
ncbi:hypothetical protein BP5796_08425 [Coleophoma crateriformis]|uniref:Uncharacterized protein n=1 Tax=Coleophoma crateriformis TaxID=565419 RepID=A0A3D8R7Z0_9HELO|nr:hypothetical protein BP5796_08425 [Coleophoma crateriformis]